MKRAVRILFVLLALLLIVEEWIWDKLSLGLRRALGLLPLERAKAAAKAWVSGLPPYGSLVLFVIPFVILLPLKVLGIWCFARGYWLLGALDIFCAKALGMAFTALIFELTKPKLMQLSWFQKSYRIVIAWLYWAHELVAPVKKRLLVSIAMLRGQVITKLPSSGLSKNSALVSRYLRRARASARAAATEKKTGSR